MIPALACDCHAHVFGPFDRYPLLESRSFDPPESLREAYLAMLDHAGLDRGVLVHASPHGWDNSATLDALRSAPGRLRGIGIVPPNTSDAVLAEMAAAGMRGLRFLHILGSNPYADLEGRLRLAQLQDFAPRLRELGWHAQIWANASVIAENEPWLRKLGIPVVIDHMGMFDVTLGVDDPSFQSLVRLVADGVIYVKLTVFRNSSAAPEFDDVRAYHDALVAANPERLLWGGDWPFLGMNSDPSYNTPRLLAKALEWWGDAGLAERVLVTNPAGLYGFAMF